MAALPAHQRIRFPLTHSRCFRPAIIPGRYAFTHRDIQGHTCTCLRIHICSHTHTLTHTLVHMHTLVHTHTPIRTHSRSHPCPHTHTYPSPGADTPVVPRYLGWHFADLGWRVAEGQGACRHGPVLVLCRGALLPCVPVDIRATTTVRARAGLPVHDCLCGCKTCCWH